MMGEYDAGYENCIDAMVRQMEDMQFRIDSLHRENAKLREQIHWLKQGDILHVLTDQEYIDQCERERLMQVSIDALDKENDKLRELVRDYIDAPCTTCDCWQDNFRCWNYDGADCGLVARARELGIEVDG